MISEVLSAGSIVSNGTTFPLLVLFLSVFCHYLSEPLRWHAYTRGSEHAGFRRLFRVFNTAALFSFILPFKLGAPARIWLMVQFLSFPLGRVSAWVLVDGLIYYATWGTLGLLAATMIGADQALPTAVRWLFLACLLVGFLALMTLRKTKTSGQSRLHRIFAELPRTLRNLSALRLALAFAVLLIDVGFQLVRHAAILDLTQIPLSLSALIPIVCISMAAGLLSPLPMGLGGYDAAIVLLLRLHGVPLPHALWIPIVNRAANFTMAILLGGIGAVQLGINPFNRKLLTDRLMRQRSGHGNQPDTPA